MKNTKIGKTRFLIGGMLVIAFSLQFLLVGLGSFSLSAIAGVKTDSSFLKIAQAELFEKQAQSGFSYQPTTLNELRALNFRSFLGKTVKIPLAGNNPDGVPGGDRDYVIIFPPRILDRNASIPLRAIYLSSGKTVDPDSVQFVHNIESYVNSIGNNNPVLLEIVKNLLQSNLKVSINTDNCGRDGACPVSTLMPLLNLAHAEDTTSSSPLLTSDDISQLTSSLGDMDTSNPQVKQLLTLVLILIMVNQSLATPLNSDKQACSDIGGEWVNDTCNSEQKSACEDNGGTFRKFTNQCLADKQVCGNNDLQCDSDNANSNNNEDNSVYSCACKTGNCLNNEGVCIPKNNSKQKACENSGGSWRSFFDSSELCLQKCGALNQTVQGGSTQSACNSISGSSSSGSSQGLMGCDCSNANTNSNQWSAAGTSAGKCLSNSGACIAKDTSKDDDDKDGVPNGQDRCPNSTPDGSGTVNMQAGTNYYGCTCTQIQALGGIQKQQQQCPPDGCESGTPYMVKYDRSQQQNNQNQLCQNGTVQQQQRQNNNTCPVISREPTDQCEREMDRKNQNKNDNLQDMLKKLLDDKKKQNQNGGQKDRGQQSGGGGGGGGGGGQQQQQTENTNTNTTVTPPGASVAIDPKGVGAYNAKQDGTNAKPYALHVSQFKKICGENTYILTNSKAGEGNFKDDPSKQSSTETPGKMPNPAADVDKLTCLVGQTGSACGQNSRDGIKKIINENWDKLDEKNQKMVSDSIKNGPMLDQMKIDRIKDIINKAPKVTAPQVQPPLQNNNGKGAESMDKLNEPGAYFKVPKCEELAQAHCCVYSCCDPSKKDCGWSIGKDCKEGKYQGKNCEGDSCSKCNEDPAKSIQLTMGNPIPKPLKQSDNKCYEINHDKEATASKLYENYSEAVHNGQCRYDGKGSTVGCEDTPNGTSCKIVINGREIQRFNDERYDNLQIAPDPKAQFTEFTNKKDGSTIQTLGEKQPAETDWIKGLSKEKGVACKCQERDKNRKNPEDKPEGYKPPPSGDQNQVKITPNTLRPNPNGTTPNQLDDRTLRDDYVKYGLMHPVNWLLQNFPTFDQYKEYRQNIQKLPQDKQPNYWDWKKNQAI